IHLRLSRFKLAGPPTPRDTEASNAYAIIHNSRGPVCSCSLIGINSALIPSITQGPSDEVEAVLAMILLEITLHKLCLHGVLEFLVPASLYFNDDCDSIVCFPLSAFDDRVYVYVRALASTNFTLSIDDNASLLDIFHKVVFDIIRKIV